MGYTSHQLFSDPPAYPDFEGEICSFLLKIIQGTYNAPHFVGQKWGKYNPGVKLCLFAKNRPFCFPAES
jgi:hypothetical protein